MIYVASTNLQLHISVLLSISRDKTQFTLYSIIALPCIYFLKGSIGYVFLSEKL